MERLIVNDMLPNKSNKGLHHDASTDLSVPQLELTLSRSCYNIGETVVGTIRLISGLNRTDKNSVNPTNTSSFKEAIVYIAGKCRLDPRWHNYKQVAELYGTHPILETLPIRESNENLQPKQTVCFFATNFVDLMQEEFQSAGKTRVSRIESGNEVNSCDVYEHDGFTFRVDLPKDIPPSAHAVCCRYYYVAVALTKLHTGKVIKVQIPFTLQSSACLSHNPYNNTRSIFLQQPTYNSSNARIQIGQCIVTPNLPAPPSPLQQLTHTSSQLAASRVSGLGSSCSTADLRSIRITNQEGLPCCILTIIGAKIMVPGGTMMLQFHFEPDVVLGRSNLGGEDHKEDTNDDRNDWNVSDLLPCLQIGICLYGEEWAIYNKEQGKKNKTRSYIFDTAHTLIQPGSVDTVAMTLTLPMDSPCTFKTDLVEMNIFCRMELTVEQRKGRVGVTGSQYEILRLELPCDVVHNIINVDESDDMGESQVDVFAIATKEKRKLENSNNEQKKRISVGDDDDIVLTKDILGDLTMLSLRLMKKEY